jgi:uncharacterized RDD family membrane protein YckC
MSGEGPPQGPGWGEQPQQQPPPPPGQWGGPPPQPQQPPPGQWGGPPPPGQWNAPPGGPPAPWGGGWQGPGGWQPQHPPLADVGSRIGAVLLDGVIFAGIAFAAFIVLAVLAGVLGMIAEALVVLVVLVGIAAYFALLFGLAVLESGPYGQTPGKHVLGIKVIKANGGQLSKGESVARYACKSFISGSICYLGYLWAFWDPERRTWHDMIVDTRVVVADRRAPSMIDVVKAPFAKT